MKLKVNKISKEEQSENKAITESVNGMSRTQEMIFSDYFFKHFGKTYSQINCKEGYRLNKEFTKKGKTYYIDVCFNNAGEYIRGFVADENGTFIIDGRGFSFEMFMDFLKELKF